MRSQKYQQIQILKRQPGEISADKEKDLVGAIARRVMDIADDISGLATERLLTSQASINNITNFAYRAKEREEKCSWENERKDQYCC